MIDGIGGELGVVVACSRGSSCQHSFLRLTGSNREFFCFPCVHVVLIDIIDTADLLEAPAPSDSNTWPTVSEEALPPSRLQPEHQPHAMESGACLSYRFSDAMYNNNTCMWRLTSRLTHSVVFL